MEQAVKKIVVVTMVKNEADIIESFVRHTLTFADLILAADHMSADRTKEILEQLAAEGLPIVLSERRQVELAHSEVMTSLMEEAVYVHGADLVLPMDGDEFLVNTESAVPCREILLGLDPVKVYRLRWRIYEPVPNYYGENRFLPHQPCQRSKDFASAQKMIIGAQAERERPFRLIQGAHYAYWLEDGGDMVQVPWEDAPLVHTAHFHWRSDEQYVAKSVTSHINNVAKYTINTPTTFSLKRCCEQIARGEKVVRGFQLENPEDFDLQPFVPPQTLRYSASVRPDPLRNLLGASVLIAEAYREEKVLQRGRSVTIVLPYLGDSAALRQSLRDAAGQTYPRKEIFICDFAAGGSGLDSAMAEADGKGVPVRLLDFGPSGRAGGDPFAQLEAQAAGDYAAWFFPGDRIRQDNLVKLVACNESQDYTYDFICQNMVRDFADWLPFLCIRHEALFLMPDSAQLWRLMLATGQCPACGISSALLPRALMRRIHWFRDGFLEGTPIPFLFWKALLEDSIQHGNLIGMLQERHVERKWDELSVDEYMYHQLAWYAMLCGMREQFSPADFRSLMGLVKRNGDAFLQAIGGRFGEGGLFRQYAMMLDEAGRLL